MFPQLFFAILTFLLDAMMNDDGNGRQYDDGGNGDVGVAILLWRWYLWWKGRGGFASLLKISRRRCLLFFPRLRVRKKSILIPKSDVRLIAKQVQKKFHDDDDDDVSKVE